MTPGTVVVLLVVVAICVLAVRSVAKKRGGCDCGCSDGGCSSCSGCDSAQVYGINVGADGLPLSEGGSSCPHCKGE